MGGNGPVIEAGFAAAVALLRVVAAFAAAGLRRAEGELVPATALERQSLPTKATISRDEKGSTQKDVGGP